MDAVFSADIVLGTRIREIIQLDIVLDTFADKAQTILPDNSLVNRTLADQKLAFQILRLINQGRLGESLRIGLHRVHVALAVHYLVPFPINHRSTGDSDLESLRIIRHERYGHESTIAPSMNTYSVRVHVWKRLQHIYSDHLISHLVLAALVMNRLLEVLAPVLRSAVVLDID